LCSIAGNSIFDIAALPASLLRQYELRAVVAILAAIFDLIDPAYLPQRLDLGPEAALRGP
jgi:hypothetical protein